MVLEDDVDAVAIDIFWSNFVKLAQKKWSEAACNKNMERKFAKWLLTDADVPDLNPKEPTSTPTSAPTTSTPTLSSMPTSMPSSKPRETKPYSELCKRSKDKETQELRSSNETAKLVHAASLSLKTSGKRDIAHLLDEADKSPSRAVKFHRLSEVAESMEIVQTCLWPPTENVSGGCTCTSFALQLAKTGLHRHPTLLYTLTHTHTHT